jgi:acetylornithine/N-succinyldiaminopimelate aminotransferase
MVDEIQSGHGTHRQVVRYQHYGIQPDITTLAKPMAGGFRWALCCARKRRRGRFIRGCMGRPSAADRWLARWRLR